MDLLSVFLPFIFLQLLILGCQGVLILKKNELSTYSSCAGGADEPFYVNLTCKFQYSNYTTAPYLTVVWTDVTDSSNILDVAIITDGGSVTPRGEYVNADITRLGTVRQDGSIRLKIPDTEARFKIFDCEVNALNNAPSIYSSTVFAYNTASVAPPSATLAGAIIALSAVVLILSDFQIYLIFSKKIGLFTEKITGLLLILSVVLSIAAIIISALYLSKHSCCYSECSGLEIGMVVCGILAFLCLVAVAVIGRCCNAGGVARKTEKPRVSESINETPRNGRSKPPDCTENGSNSMNLHVPA